MYLHTLLLLLKFYLVNSFGFNGRGNGYRFLKKDINGNAVAVNSDTRPASWIEQPLDHFDENEKRTWKMRYYEYCDQWKSGGPIYLYINGEAGIDSPFLGSEVLDDLIRETNGIMFVSEHRYYGKSKPLSNLTTANMAYLSSRQALADNARLLSIIKLNETFKDSKVVVIGCSYAGNLAAWIKLMYPKLVDAVISSSAPVLAKVDFYEYLETVTEDYRKYGPPGCIKKIEQGFQRYENLLRTEKGIEELKKEENICDDNDLKRDEDRQLFFVSKVDFFTRRAQYDSPEGINITCTMYQFPFPTDLDDSNVWNEKSKCFDYKFENFIQKIQINKDDEWSWWYQTCTEFGYYQTTYSDKQPFTRNIPIEFYYKMCMNLFGAEFDEQRIQRGVRRTNKMYGGLNPNVDHVVYVNGDMDPWSRLGILKDISPNAPARVIPRASHGQDLSFEAPYDSKEMKETRKYVKNLVKNWIRPGKSRIN